MIKQARLPSRTHSVVIIVKPANGLPIPILPPRKPKRVLRKAFGSGTHKPRLWHHHPRPTRPRPPHAVPPRRAVWHEPLGHVKLGLRHRRVGLNLLQTFGIHSAHAAMLVIRLAVTAAARGIGWWQHVINRELVQALGCCTGRKRGELPLELHSRHRLTSTLPGSKGCELFRLDDDELRLHTLDEQRQGTDEGRQLPVAPEIHKHDVLVCHVLHEDVDVLQHVQVLEGEVWEGLAALCDSLLGDLRNERWCLVVVIVGGDIECTQ